MMNSVPVELVASLENLSANERLDSWNKGVEDILKTTSIGDLETSSSSSPDDIWMASNLLHDRTLQALLQEQQDVESLESQSEENSRYALNEWKELSSDSKIAALEVLNPLLRACKNWLRWFLHAYAASPSPHNITPMQGKEMERFKTKPMLELYMLLMDELSFSQPDMSRNAALLLFYCTFNPIPSSDENSQSTYAFLVRECKFFSRMIKNLATTDSVPLCVALVRNAHNLVASFPPSVPELKQSAFTMDDGAERSSWIGETSDPITIETIFRRLLEYVLFDSESGTPFPGDASDLRAELVQEIMRTFYAIRLGQELHTDSQLMGTFCRLINMDRNEKRTVDCKLASITVLMDSGEEASRILQQDGETIKSLLQMLDLQITQTINSSQVDDTGSATLIPILVVLYKFCQNNKAFREATTMSVFPECEEPHFRRLVAAEQQRSPRARNMSPLDAPEGSLRKRLIQLLTWTHSQTKRLAGELLWILCNDDSQEFVYRVGMGNALPLLSQKGLAQLPANTFS